MVLVLSECVENALNSLKIKPCRLCRDFGQQVSCCPDEKKTVINTEIYPNEKLDNRVRLNEK